MLTVKANLITPYGEELVNLVVDEKEDRKSTRLNSSHLVISYAVFCLKKKNKHTYVGDRERRLLGKTMIYPMGWDDNGLRTERRVQKYFVIRYDRSRHVVGNVHAAPSE